MIICHFSIMEKNDAKSLAFLELCCNIKGNSQEVMLTFFKDEKNIGYKQNQGAICNQVGMLYWETKTKTGQFSMHVLHIEWQLVMSLHVCICVHLCT